MAAPDQFLSDGQKKAVWSVEARDVDQSFPPRRELADPLQKRRLPAAWAAQQHQGFPPRQGFLKDPLFSLQADQWQPLCHRGS